MSDHEEARAPERPTASRQRDNDIVGADDHEAGSEKLIGPEDEDRTVDKDEPSAAQKVKDDFLGR